MQNWTDWDNGNNGDSRVYLTDATNAALTEEEKKDLENDPLCFMGVAGETDIYGPQATCCRGYELDDRQGKYIDWCLKEDENEDNKYIEHNYALIDMWDRHTWNKEISSMWCGDEAMAVCKPESGIKDYTIGGEIRDDLGVLDNAFVHCKIVPYDGHAAMLYEDKACKGKNYPIKLEDDKLSTECAYDSLSFLYADPHDWVYRSVRSVRLN